MMQLTVIVIGLLLHIGHGIAASNISLNIIPSGPVAPRIGGVLNITCQIATNASVEHAEKYKLEWIVPETTDYSRINFTRHLNALTLLITYVLDGDSGVYFCNASNEDLDKPSLIANVTVLKIVPKKGTCSPGFFICQNGDCIIQRFVCDGRPDCPDSSDEVELQCGPEPCKGKIPCDGRCIPNELCCFPPIDGLCPNHQPDCCKEHFFMKEAFGQYQLVEYPHRGLANDPHRGILEDRHKRYESDMGFLQSTIYTIIGCAIAFIFIVTIMVVAVCRVHMKQAAMSPHPRTLMARNSMYWTHRSTQDLAACASESEARRLQHLAYPPSANLMVTYNINNGVQLVGHLVDPPPYSEIADEAPIADGPPPPYSSAESLHPPASPSSQSPTSDSGGQPNQALLRPNMLISRGGDEE